MAGYFQEDREERKPLLPPVKSSSTSPAVGEEQNIGALGDGPDRSPAPSVVDSEASQVSRTPRTRSTIVVVAALLVGTLQNKPIRFWIYSDSFREQEFSLPTLIRLFFSQLMVRLHRSSRPCLSPAGLLQAMDWPCVLRSL